MFCETVFTNAVLWTPKNVDLKTAAIDCQKNNLGIAQRVGGLVGPYTAEINMTLWDDGSIIQTINLVVHWKEEKLKRFLPGLPIQTLQTLAPDLKGPLFPWTSIAKPTLSTDWRKELE